MPPKQFILYLDYDLAANLVYMIGIKNKKLKFIFPLLVLHIKSELIKIKGDVPLINNQLPWKKNGDKYTCILHTSRHNETGPFLLVGARCVSSCLLVCGVSKTSFCSSAVVSYIFFGNQLYDLFPVTFSRRKPHC